MSSLRQLMLSFSFKLTLISIALALLTVSTFSALLPPSEDYQPSNPYWNGLELFFKTTNATSINLAYDRVTPENSIIFMIGPSINLTQLHIEALRKYLLEGGTLIIMDETEAVNPILSGLGLNVSVYGYPMLDPVFYYGSWRIPKIINVDLTDVESIALNIPSTLNIKDSRLKILAYSSSFSFLDLDGDSEPSAGEPTGPFPIAAVTAYGRGCLIIFSDSSIFLNSIIILGNNLKLLQSITKGRRVFVDVGVWQPTPQLAYRNTVLNVYKAFSTPELKYSLAFTAVVLIYMLTHRGKPTPTMDEVNELVKKHPSWSRHLLEALKKARDKVAQRS